MISDSKNLVLNEEQIRQKIKRMAFEIYEQNFSESNIILAGIDPMGYRFAELLKYYLLEVSPLNIVLARIGVDKTATLQSEISLDIATEEYANKVVIIVDDVLNTGRTLAYSFKPFLQTSVKKIEVAVLVDRGHHNFPVEPNYIGYSLSTTINEHIEVRLNDDNDKGYGVYLH